MAHHLEYLLVSLLFAAWGCSAQLTSSRGNFTFCPGDSVTLTCSMPATAHVWQFSGNAAILTLVPVVTPTINAADGNIVFAITGNEGGIITSTMTFTASVSVISNGTWVACSNTTIEPRMTFNETVDIFGTVSPPHMPTLTRVSGDYTSLTLSFQQPLYGHECVTGYRVSGSNIMEQSTTQAMLISGLDLCQIIYSFSLFAQTANGDGSAITVTSNVPDFSDLGQVSNLSISADGSLLQWTPPPNAPDGCISGYTIQWPGNNVTINGSANSVQVSTLIRENNNGLPFCVDVLTTVTPRVSVQPTPLLSSQNDPPATLVYPDPDFPSPSIVLRGSGSGGDGTGLDTVVSWQEVSSSRFGENINMSAGIQQGGQCQATLIEGTSKVVPHECSAAGTVVEFCVVFEHNIMQCRKMNVSSRQLPSVNTSAVTVSQTADTIKVEINLRNISGGRCNVNGLRIVSTLFQNNVATTSDNRSYSSGLNVITFSGLKSGTSYNYQISVTEGSNVIASYSGQVGTVSPFPVVVIVVPIVVVVLILIIIIVVVLVLVFKLKKGRGSGKDGDTHELNAMDRQNMSDVDHVQAPSGEEYAVVEKIKPKFSKSTSSDNQPLYQDPNTIEHEEAPKTGDLYAVTEKKPKKKKGGEKQPTQDELAMMYSVPDKSKKTTGGVTYAAIDVCGGSDDRPIHQPLQTEYATVVS